MIVLCECDWYIHSTPVWSSGYSVAIYPVVLGSISTCVTRGFEHAALALAYIATKSDVQALHHTNRRKGH